MWRVMIRGFMAHKRRLLLTGLAVLLGVSFVAGTYVLTDTMDTAFTKIVDQGSVGVDFYVRGVSSFSTMAMSERQLVPEELIDEVAKIPDVEFANGVVNDYTLLFKGDEQLGTAPAPLMGMSWSPNPRAAVKIIKGEPPGGPREVAIDAATAKKNDLDIGDTVGVVTKSGYAEAEIVGTVGLGEVETWGGATMTVFDLETAQSRFERRGYLDTIEVSLAEGADPTEVRRAVSALLPEGFEALSATKINEEANDMIGTFLGYMRTGMLVFALIALFVGAFIIFNTFSIVVTQRTREFALLRALGASPAQVRSSVVGEGLIVGLVASAAGIPLGVLIAVGLQKMLRGFGMDLPTTGAVLQARTIIMSALLGVVVTAFSAVLPALRAARVPPITAMQSSAEPPRRTLVRRSMWGAAITLGGVVLLALGLFGSVQKPLMFVGSGALAVFIGMAALSALVAKPFARAIGTPLPGLSARLARDNSMRNGRRTATTASALMIGVGLIAFVSIFSASLKASSTGGLERSLKADYILSMGGWGMTGMAPKVAESLERLPQVEAASGLRNGEFRLDGASRFVAAIDPVEFPLVADLEVQEGRLEALKGSGVFISDNVAEDEDLGVGDVLTMEFALSGVHHMEIDGVFANGAAVQSDYVMAIDTFEQNFNQQLDMLVYVKGAEGIPGETLKGLVDRAAAAFPGLEAMDRQEYYDSQAGQIDQALGMITALLGLAILIGLLGIANTLALSVLERTREIGLLRAVGMTRAQVRSMVRWESVITSLLGTVLGISVGVFFGWAIVTAMADQGVQEFRLPGGSLLFYAAMAAMAGVVAALLPARRAAKLDVLAAIATE